MIINFKYHIASLMAVFMALAVGILIGSVLPGDNALLNQQEQLSDNIETQLDLLKKNNEQMKVVSSGLELENNSLKQFGSQIIIPLVDQKLQGKNVAIINTGGYSLPEDFILTLKNSGANIASITTLTNGLELNNLDTILAKLTLYGYENNVENLRAKLSGEIIDIVVKGDTKGILTMLTELELVKTEGDMGAIVTDIVLVGGNPDKDKVYFDEVDGVMINYCTQNKILVYGMEQSNVTHSYMEEYQKKRLSTVDNIDSPPGQFSAVKVLEGKEGNFGIKSTAQKLIPELE